MISLIWAMDKNNLIGKGNRLPWHIKEDLLYFKEKTANQIVLMGHLTYLSLKSYYKEKPFPYQKIYVANLEEYDYTDAIRVPDLIDFLKSNKEDIFVIGGKIIYELSLKYADYLYITYVDGEYEGDTYFENLDLSLFVLESEDISGKLNFSVYRRVLS